MAAKKKTTTKKSPDKMVNPALAALGYSFIVAGTNYGPGDKVPKTAQASMPRHVRGIRVLENYAPPESYAKAGRESSAGAAAVEAVPRPPRESSAPKPA